MSEVCFLARIRGRVQGVSFRYHTRNQAEGLGIRGWVRNQPDGSVEACICGEQKQITAMQQWLKHGPAYATVSDIKFEKSEHPGQQSGFYIL
jgi:acylphosphatase